MKTIMNWLAESFSPKMNTIISKPWIAGISSAMQKIIPFILVGSLISFYNVIRTYIPSLPDLGPISSYSFGLISVVIAFAMGQQLMEKLEKPFYTINCGLTSMLVFFMFIMPVIEAPNITFVLSRLGGSGIAVGMFAGVFTSIVFNLYSRLHVLENSTSVPDFVIGWINTIIPIIFVLGVSMILTINLHINVFDFVIWMFSPLTGFAQTMLGFVLICLIPAIFYSMGISSWLFSAVTTPIFLAAIQENIAVVAQGGSAVNIVTGVTVYTAALMSMGGMGNTLGLNFLMMFSKSKRLKALGRIFIAPSMFNINEPIVYGAPIVLNPMLMLPMWLCTIVGCITVYGVMWLGWLNIPAQFISVANVPIPIGSFIATQDFRGIIWAIVLFVIYILIWYPFFKIYEKECIAQEVIDKETKEQRGVE